MFHRLFANTSFSNPFPQKYSFTETETAEVNVLLIHAKTEFNAKKKNTKPANKKTLKLCRLKHPLKGGRELGYLLQMAGA